ncbi:MAG: acyl-CoA dehydrogenase [Gammaproteobacteria bacterium]|nr:acyl-CoA dehydrogenase [Gammaproteobacteria bacterium]MDH5803335.1 acyl-CoA dehydrogenase [Gammaproteobacteria bacterium]
MQTLIWLLIFLGVFWSIFYFRVSLLLGTGIVALTLVAWGKLAAPGVFWQILAWGTFLTPAVVLNVTALRRQWITGMALQAFKKVIPTMSQTEKEALEAGSVWWDGELFSGNPQWQRLLQTPKPQLSSEEQGFLDGPVQQLCEMIDDWKVTHEDHDLPEPIWQFIKDNGFFGMIIPKSYGGLEFSALAHSSVVVKISTRSITAAVTVMVPNSLGPAELLLRYGTQEQKNHYLPRLAKGQEVPCFALTSPEAGSDAASMVDNGIVCRSDFEGKKDVLGIRLNWSKRYITLGPVATVLGLAFKLYDPEHLLGETENLGITCALIPTNTPGVKIGNRHFPLDMAFQNGPNEGKDVFIPMDWIIGGQSQVGNGWRMLMECLAAGRSISLPALSTGAGKLSSRATGAYARIRQQFKTAIGNFEGVEEPLARIGGYTYMLDAARTLTTSALDQGESPSVISAIVKYNFTETMRTVCNDAMDIQGGSGICLGPRNWLGRIYQSIPISITVEGANILTRSLIIFGQGAIRCHPYVLKEMLATKEPDEQKALEDFDDAFTRHVGFSVSNASRSLFLGLTNARFAKAPVSGPTAVYYRQLSRMSSAFAFLSDMSMLIMGGDLKRKEKLSGRLADILSHLYLASATLKRFEDDGQPAQDLPLVQWSCENSLRVMQQSMDKFLNNFPIPVVAWVLRRIVLPLGKKYSGPSDRLGHKVAKLLQRPSPTRDRLTAGIFLPNNLDKHIHTEPLARLEYALNCVIEAEDADKRLRKAIRSGQVTQTERGDQIDAAVELELLSKDDAQLLNKADTARRDVIWVDDFEPEYFQRNNDSSEPPLSAKECA